MIKTNDERGKHRRPYTPHSESQAAFRRSCDGRSYAKYKMQDKDKGYVRRSEEYAPGYLEEFMWRERAGPDKFKTILNVIAVEYPVA